MAEISEDKMEVNIASRFAFNRAMSVRNIETGIGFIMSREKRPERIHYRAFAYVVWPYQHIQTRLKFQRGFAQLAEVLDGQLSEVHEGLHPCFYG
ncbi:hypothetical protein D3C77_528490 [compost metagenome]